MITLGKRLSQSEIDNLINKITSNRYTFKHAIIGNGYIYGVHLYLRVTKDFITIWNQKRRFNNAG